MSSFNNNDRKAQGVLLLVAFFYYFAYLMPLVTNPNGVISQGSGDDIKNYYTFIYHTAADSSLVHFGGMNYPYGEHVVYTDCQPLLTWILRPFTFLHAHLTGVLHILLFVSFVVTPLILFRALRRLGCGTAYAMMGGLAIAILSPQTMRLGGHFALAYNCIIPFLLLLLLRQMQEPRTQKAIALSAWCLAVFFIHPYLGFGSSVFTTIALLFHAVVTYRNEGFYRNALRALVTGISPVIVFRLFMFATDHHAGRSSEPFADHTMLVTAGSLFTPFTGPLRHFMQQIVKVTGMHWEALSYTGAFMFFASVAVIVIVLVKRKRLRVDPAAAALLSGGAIMLLFAFGLPMKLAALLDLGQSLVQFRAGGRFAWFFYFSLPLFVLPVLSTALNSISRLKTRKGLLITVPLLMLLLNAVENHALIRLVTLNKFHDRNIFNADELDQTALARISAVQNLKPDAILPLPLFHIGSEVFFRDGNSAVKDAFMLSWHLRRPLISVMMSRTSVPETEQVIGILNTVKHGSLSTVLLNKRIAYFARPHFAISDETGLCASPPVYTEGDSIKAGLVKPNVKSYVSFSDCSVCVKPGRSDEAWTERRSGERTVIGMADGKFLKSGAYTASFHYGLKMRSYRYAGRFYVAAKSRTGITDTVFSGLMKTSGFYSDHVVPQMSFNADTSKNYEFGVIQDFEVTTRYRNLLLRPVSADIVQVIDGDSLFNNLSR